MASTSTLRQSSRQIFKNTIGVFRTNQRPVTRQARQNIQTKPPRRHASTSTNPSGAQYHIPKRAVHIGTPLLAYSYLMLYITEPHPSQKTLSEPEPEPTTCTKIHASDLNKYIKSHPDTISDDHDLAWNHMYKAFKEHQNNQSEPNKNADLYTNSTHCTKTHASDLNKFIKSHPSILSADQIRGWNKMYMDFKQHRKNQSEPARIEEENARLLAGYARAEDIKHRSTKVPGVMATEAGNKSIMHQPVGLVAGGEKEKHEASVLEAMSFSEKISARVEEVKRKFTAATKGMELL